MTDDIKIETIKRILKDALAKSFFEEIKTSVENGTDPRFVELQGEIIDFNATITAPKNFLQALTEICAGVFKQDIEKNFDAICSYIFMQGFIASTMDFFPEPSDILQYIVERSEEDKNSKEVVADVLKKVSDSNLAKRAKTDRRVSEMLAVGEEQKQKEENYDKQKDRSDESVGDS